METATLGQGSYDAAVSELYGPTHQALSSQAIGNVSARRSETVKDMLVYLRRLQLTDTSVNLPIIHITGTKGKGSTACMCEHILRHKGYRTGLFTSPHLIDIRERIRINGKLISKDCFADLYWTVRRKLQECANDDTLVDRPQLSSAVPSLPGYFRMLTLMAVYCFVHYDPPIDVIILEVGMGGRYDATNAISSTFGKLCGITLIDYDHVRELGTTLEAIAWHKGGIYTKSQEPQQPQSPLFVLDTNSDSVIKVFVQCANETNGSVQLVGRKTSRILPSSGVSMIGLSGEHQVDNAELALAMCTEFLKRVTSVDVTEQQDEQLLLDMMTSLSTVSWPGRCQVVHKPTMAPGGGGDDDMQLCLDGGHTIQSIQAGLDWFNNANKEDGKSPCQRALIFNCSHERNPVDLLRILVTTSRPFHTVCFAYASTERPSAIEKKSAREWLMEAGIDYNEAWCPSKGSSSPTTWQDTLACLWKHLERNHGISSSSSSLSSSTVILSNVDMARALALLQETPGIRRIFMTGSLYLVGDALRSLDWNESEDDGVLLLRQSL